MTYIHASHAYT